MKQHQEHDRSIAQEQADQVRRTTGATLAARALEEVLPALGKGYGPNMHRRAAERMVENMSRITFHVDHYEPDDEETGTRMVVNCNATEQHAGEAASMLEAAPDLYAALEGLLAQLDGPVMVHGDGRGLNGEKTGLSGDEFNALRKSRLSAARAALARANGGAA